MLFRIPTANIPSIERLCPDTYPNKPTEEERERETEAERDRDRERQRQREREREREIG